MKTLQHLAAMAIITIIMGVIYASVQQTYRSGANDPQTEIAYDLRNQIQEGSPSARFFSDTIDLEKSLSVFIETFDAEGRPIQSTGYLRGQKPQLPRGVLDHAKEQGEHWLTWQPQRNVRMALGILKLNAGPVAFLAVGRSLSIVQERISNLGFMVVVGWVLCMAIILLHWLLQNYYLRQENYRSAL